MIPLVPVSQLVEETASKAVCCGFDSRPAHATMRGVCDVPKDKRQSRAWFSRCHPSGQGRSRYLSAYGRMGDGITPW